MECTEKKKTTLEDLIEIWSKEASKKKFEALRHHMENICEAQVFSAFLTQVHLIYL